MVPFCSGSLPAFKRSIFAFLIAIFRILAFVVVVPLGLTVAPITCPLPLTIISTATFAFSLKSSSKLGSFAMRLPSSPLLMLTPPPAPAGHLCRYHHCRYSCLNLDCHLFFLDHPFRQGYLGLFFHYSYRHYYHLL